MNTIRTWSKRFGRWVKPPTVEWLQRIDAERGAQAMKRAAIGILDGIAKYQWYRHCPREWLPESAKMPAYAGVAELTQESDAPYTKYPTLPQFDHHRTGGDDPPDTGWMSCFMMRDERGTNSMGFKIRDKSTNVKFTAKAPGEPTDYYKVTGTTTEVEYTRYSAGLLYDKKWLTSNDGWWDAQTQAADFGAQYVEDQAAYFYTVLTDAQTATRAFDTSIRNTINLGCRDIITALQAKKWPVSPSPTFNLIVPTAALEVWEPTVNNTSQFQYTTAGSGSTDAPAQGATLLFSINVIRTQNASGITSGSALLMLPARQIQGGISEDLTVIDEHDASTNTLASTGYGYYGGGVGESDQLIEVASS